MGRSFILTRSCFCPSYVVSSALDMPRSFDILSGDVRFLLVLFLSSQERPAVLISCHLRCGGRFDASRRLNNSRWEGNLKLFFFLLSPVLLSKQVHAAACLSILYAGIAFSCRFLRFFLLFSFSPPGQFCTWFLATYLSSFHMGSGVPGCLSGRMKKNIFVGGRPSDANG